MYSTEIKSHTCLLHSFQVSNPMLSNVTFKYATTDILAHSLTSTNFHTYYQGSEMVVAGQLPSDAAKSIEYEIVANQANGQYTASGTYDTSNMVCSP